MSDAPLLVVTEGGVARLTLNRPDVGNAIDLNLARLILQAVRQCETDPAVRCVVLTGAGRFFCTGGDVGTFGASDGAAAAVGELAGVMHQAILHLSRMAKPVLVLVNGPAAGGGLGLAISGDMVLAARSAHFTAAFSAIGVTPDSSATWRLPRLIGLRRAQDMLLTSRRVEAEEAETIGLITRAVDDAALAEEGEKLAAKLAASATGALGVTRQLLIDSYEVDLESQLEREKNAIASAAAGPEGQEGVAAFLDKRKPNFPQIG